MDDQKTARFTVTVTSVENVTWQGEVEAGGEIGRFESEMQLLHWLLARFPQLLPEHTAFTPK